MSTARSYQQRSGPPAPATPADPGTIPGGIRDRAMRAVMERGPQPEDKEKTRASQKFWAAKRAGDRTSENL